MTLSRDELPARYLSLGVGLGLVMSGFVCLYLAVDVGQATAAGHPRLGSSTSLRSPGAPGPNSPSPSLPTTVRVPGPRGPAVGSDHPASASGKSQWRRPQDELRRTDEPMPESFQRGFSNPNFAWVAELTFEFDSASVSETRAGALLNPLIKAARAESCRKLVVDGHSNDVGDRQHNLLLSWQRATAIRTWLAERGVPEGQIVVRSFGAFQPKPTIAPEAHEQRRVEVRLLECSDGEGSR